MNDNLLKNQTLNFDFDIKINKKNRFFKTQKILFNKDNKLIGFFDMKNNVYDFRNKCFKINLQKVRLVNGFHFNFSISFLDDSFYVDMEGYLCQLERKKIIKAFFKSGNVLHSITSEKLNYLQDDGVPSRKNLQFFINEELFFKVYKTKNKEYKIIFDNVDKNQIILVSMITSCLFIKV